MIIESSGVDPGCWTGVESFDNRQSIIDVESSRTGSSRVEDPESKTRKSRIVFDAESGLCRVASSRVEPGYVEPRRASNRVESNKMSSLGRIESRVPTLDSGRSGRCAALPPGLNAGFRDLVRHAESNAR